MKWLFLIFASLILSACEQEPEGAPSSVKEPPSVATPIGSQALGANFPLLPVIEPRLWTKLTAAEKALESGNASASGEIERISTKLNERHPFRMGEEFIELGDVRYHKESGRFSLPAVMCYPREGDARHPGELELLLCTETGRTHETLLTSTARPLHLELLMHLVGKPRGPKGSKFRAEIRSSAGGTVSVEQLVADQNGEPWPQPLIFEFSGSEFGELYSPDLTGDFAIFWHAHDSVLRITDQGIANGETKLRPVKHPKLPNGDAVTVELVPLGE